MKLQPLKGRSFAQRIRDHFPQKPYPIGPYETSIVAAAVDKRARKNARDVREGRCS